MNRSRKFEPFASWVEEPRKRDMQPTIKLPKGKNGLKLVSRRILKEDLMKNAAKLTNT